MVKIGPRVPMMAVSIEVAIVMAIRNEICVRNKPIDEAAAIFQKSPLSTFSEGMNSEMSQKSAVAPAARSVKSTYGDRTSELAISLQKTILRPKIV